VNELRLYSTLDAAAYLDLSIHGIRHHLYTSRLLKGNMIGGVLVFTQDELDSFKAKEPRKPGRKKAGE